MRASTLLGLLAWAGLAVLMAAGIIVAGVVIGALAEWGAQP